MEAYIDRETNLEFYSILSRNVDHSNFLMIAQNVRR